MARPSLSGARKTTAKAVAEKIAGKGSTKSTSAVADKIPLASSPIVSSNTSGFSVTVPGLVGISPDGIAAMMPQFQENSYAISDPLNPPESLPQVSEAQFDKGMGIYEGTQRALKLIGTAFDTTRERFTVVGKQAKAFGAGIKAATEFEKVKGDFLDYQGQLETNEQKGISLGVSQHKTSTDRTAAVHTTASLDEKLKQAEIAAELARASTQDKQNKLDEYSVS
ncbi:MAG TPA: hypothetical protein V6D37_15030 [Candidatus Sericytochromatia bacterium]|jgi:hypothetical protein